MSVVPNAVTRSFTTASVLYVMSFLRYDSVLAVDSSALEAHHVAHAFHTRNFKLPSTVPVVYLNVWRDLNSARTYYVLLAILNIDNHNGTHDTTQFFCADVSLSIHEHRGSSSLATMNFVRPVLPGLYSTPNNP